MTRVVCALSGGGAKAAAHLGAWKALSEHGLAPHHYVATSMGAVVAAMLAAGVPYEEAVGRLARLRRRDLAGLGVGLLLGPFGESLFRLKPLRQLIRRLVPVDRFDQLDVPLTATVADVDSGELVLLGEGGVDVPLVDALVATCALPIYFPPVELRGRRVADGGLRAVLPLDTARRFDPDLVFAVHVGPSFRELPAAKKSRLPSLVRRHGEVVRVMMAAQAEDMIAEWPGGDGPELVLVRPAVRAETTFAVELVVSYVEEGYRAAMRALGARVPQ